MCRTSFANAVGPQRDQYILKSPPKNTLEFPHPSMFQNCIRLRNSMRHSDKL